jgi:hypothetical protein
MWKDIVKVDDDKGKGKTKKRWEDYRLSQERGGREKKPDQPKLKCAMCGRGLSKYNKEHKQGQLNFCKTCKKARGN